MSLYTPGAKCQEPGCDEPPGALGLCAKHKAANRANIKERLNPKPPPRKASTGRRRMYPVGAVCSIEGCGKPVRAKWLCATHWGRQKRHGDPLATVKKKNAIRQGRPARRTVAMTARTPTGSAGSTT